MFADHLNDEENCDYVSSDDEEEKIFKAKVL